MLDRTGSVSSTNRALERDAAKNMVDLLLAVPNNRVAIGRFGDAVDGGEDAETIHALSNNATTIKSAIDSGMTSSSPGGTNLEDAVEAGRRELQLNGNAGSQQIYILLSDGDANENDTCNEDIAEGDDCIVGDDAAAADAADELKALGYTFIAIAFDASGSGGDVQNRALLASMATQPSADSTGTGGVTPAEQTLENGDGDNFYIAPGGADLAAILNTIGNEILCDDQVECTVDTCVEGSCQFQPSDMRCDDNDPCTADSCSVNGGCSHDPIPNCTSCTPDNAGTVCNDGNPCTDDVCSDTGICEHPVDTGNSCDDGSFCNGTESCTDAGQCVSSGNPCEGGNACNNVCDETANDCFTGANGQGCEDGDQNECTGGQCVNGACEPMNQPGQCSDGVLCTTADTCSNGSCSGVPVTCVDDGIECTVESCDPNTGNCVTDDSGCECEIDADCPEDGNLCTGKVCDPNTRTCQYPPLGSDTSCSDGLFCNGEEFCDGQGTCGAGTNPCADGEECADNCNEVNDTCNDPQGTACTDDGNPCTDNECSGDGACVPVNNTADCEDGDSCTLGDVCSGGECQAGGPKDCSDNRECTTHSCDSDTGECLTDNSACECNGDLDCDDGNPCTAGACDLDSGTCVQEILVGTTCDDGDNCTNPDQCNEVGACVGSTVSCDDDNACTADVCDTETGACLNTDNGECPPPNDCEAGDADLDGVCDPEDNCPNTANSDQTDSNGNGIGNACENPGDSGGGQTGDPVGGPVVPTGFGLVEGSGSCSLQAGPNTSRSWAPWFFMGILLIGWSRLRFRRN